MALKDYVNFDDDRKISRAERTRYGKESRKRAFARALVNNGYDSRNAAIEAGYSPHLNSAAASAASLLKDESVALIINEYERQKELTSIVTREWVIMQLMDTVTAAKEGRTITAAEKANMAEFDGKTVIDACNSIAEIMKFYEKGQITNNHITQTNISMGQDNQLLVQLTTKYDADYDK